MFCDVLSITGNNSSVAFDPSGTRVVSGSHDHTIRVWSTHSCTCLHTLQGHSDAVTSVAFDPSGTRVVSGSDDRTIRMWSDAVYLLRWCSAPRLLSAQGAVVFG